MPRPRQLNSKRRGYDVEVEARDALRELWPTIERRGSVAYKKSACDLTVPGMVPREAWPLVVTKDKRHPLLVTTDIDTFIDIVRCGTNAGLFGVGVQVKARETTWVGTLHAELVRTLKEMG